MLYIYIYIITNLFHFILFHIHNSFSSLPFTATKRFDAKHGADREIQRILMEMLNQMDGFDQTVNVKVIMATNRADTLDPALLRPGRLDRKIEFPLPDRRQKRLIFQVITSKMNLAKDVDLEDCLLFDCIYIIFYMFIIFYYF